MNYCRRCHTVVEQGHGYCRRCAWYTDGFNTAADHADEYVGKTREDAQCFTDECGTPEALVEQSDETDAEVRAEMLRVTKLGYVAGLMQRAEEDAAREARERNEDSTN